MIELPYPPSVNKMYTNRKFDGRRLLTKIARQWKKEAFYLLKSQKPKDIFNKNIIFTMIVYPPDRRKRDTSNLIKIVEDALVDSEWMIDDRYVIKHFIHKEMIVKGGKIFVSLNSFDKICPVCQGRGLNNNYLEIKSCKNK